MSKITHLTSELSQYTKPSAVSFFNKDTAGENTVAGHMITDTISISNHMESNPLELYVPSQHYKLWQDKKSEDQGWYSNKTIAKVGNELIRLQGYKEDQFIDYANLDTLQLALSERKNKVPLFVIYNINGNHWITFCVIKLDSGTYKALIKDSLDYSTDNLKKVLRDQLHITDHDIIEHKGKEQKDNISCGAMALKNMSIMAEKLKATGAEDFCRDFQTIQFCEQADVLTIKAEYDNIYKSDLQYIDNITSRLMAREYVSELELEKFYNLAVSNKLHLPSELLVSLEKLSQRTLDGVLRTELDSKCKELPSKGEGIKYNRAILDRKKELEELRVNLPIKLLLKAINDNTEYKLPSEVVDELINIIDSGKIATESGIKQNAIDIINILVQRDKSTLTDLQKNRLTDFFNYYIRIIDSDVGENVQKFAISLFKLLQDKILADPKFKPIDVLGKIAAIDNQPILKEILIQKIAQTIDSSTVISDEALIRIIESSQDNTLIADINKIISQVIRNQKSELAKKVLETLKQVRFTPVIIDALKEYCDHGSNKNGLDEGLSIEIENVNKIIGQYTSRIHHLLIKALLVTSTNSDTTSGVLDIFSNALKEQNSSSSEILEFIKQVFIETTRDELRLKAAAIIKTSDNYSQLPQHLQELVSIEQDIAELAKNSENLELKNGIITKIQNYVAAGNKLTPSCFKLLGSSIQNENTLLAINQVVSNNQQTLPLSLTEQLYEQIKAGSVNDKLVDIITKGSVIYQA